MCATNDPNLAHEAELRALIDQLRWNYLEGIYRASEHYHIIARPSLPNEDQRCAVVIALRPRLPTSILPRQLAFGLRSDVAPRIIHYGRFNQIGQAQVVHVHPGQFELRSFMLRSAHVADPVQSGLHAAWVVDRTSSAYAAEHDVEQRFHFQHAEGDLIAQLEVRGDYVQVHLLAYGERWAHMFVALGWEDATTDSSDAANIALLPLRWHQSLACWSGRVQIATTHIRRFWPPLLPLDYTVLATLSDQVLQASVTAAASLSTRQEWRNLAADPRLPLPVRTAIEAHLTQASIGDHEV
jgi:hypothetical protein